MKTTLLLFLFLSTIKLVAQTYTLVHVENKILRASNQQALATADQLTEKDSLSFIKQQAWAIVAAPGGALFFVQSQEEKASVNVLKEVLIPIDRTKREHSKKTTEAVTDLKTFFSGEQFVFIGTQYKLNVDPAAYPLDEKLFLLYRYEYQSRIITHKLPAPKQVVAFDPNYLYQYKGETIPYQKTTKTELSYFNSNTNIPVLAAAFRPIWLEEEALKKELLVLKQVNGPSKKSKEEWKILFLDYVLDIYGKTDEAYFFEWVEKAGL